MILRDENGQPKIFYHGTTALVDKEGNLAGFDPKMTKDGGVHFGDFDQAYMRNQDSIVPVTLDFERTKRCKDHGSGWKDEIKKARKQGYDSIVYLNRYEGVPTMALQRLFALGLGTLEIDKWPDAKFKRYVPEARDSYIAFYPNQIKIVEVPKELEEANMAAVLAKKKVGLKERIANEDKLRKKLKIPLMMSGVQ